MRDSSEPIPGDGLSLVGAAALLDDYFERLRGAAARLRIGIDEDSLAELLAHVEHRLEGTDRSDDSVRRVLAELGGPEALALTYAADDRTHRAGTFLGIPYDTRQPTSERFASRSWDPSDPSILVPKALGIGWTVNFAALAVRAHLIRPDDEDEPFAEAPARVVTATLAAPILVGLVFAAVAAATWSGLPETVPSHWGATGEPDGYSSRTTNLLILTGFVLLPLLAAAWVHLARRAAWNRVAASAGSLALARVALARMVQTQYSVQGGTGVWPTLIGLGLTLVLPLGLLVAVSRSGRAAEQRRDFALSSKKGTAL